jgi:hypothetical protein
MSPQRSKRTGWPPSSENRPLELESSPITAHYGGQFTKSKQSHSGDPGQKPPSEGIDPEATELFPPDLFRLPVPNEVFGQMPEMSDAALRCLLALIHQSFRFDPESSTWTCSGESFSRREIERKTSLSDQGTRNGLASLEEAGWVNVDRSGRGYRYALRMEVPTQRYTYVPTTLLEKDSELPSTTALRAVLVVLRATWGWTSKEDDSDENRSKTVHRRWVEISTSRLSRLTGRSEPALREAIRALEGEWISRAQPSRGAYLYRLLPDALGPESEPACKEGSPEENRSEKLSSKPRIPNEVTPDRQQSYPPSSYRESSCRDKQPTEVNSNGSAKTQTEPTETKEVHAVPDSQNESGREEATDLSQFSDRKRSLGRKLINAGIWPNRAKECLQRYSASRIEANFELFRERAPEIDDHGAWLCTAITEGYANVPGDAQPKGTFGGETSSQDSPEGSQGRSNRDFPRKSQTARGDRHLPDHKEKISARRKQALIRHRSEVKAEHFHRFRYAESPDKAQFLYFDPTVGGPRQRRPEKSASPT